MIEHLPQNPKIMGLDIANVNDREKMVIIKLFLKE
jgi:hypothetical protein